MSPPRRLPPSLIDTLPPTDEGAFRDHLRSHPLFSDVDPAACDAALDGVEIRTLPARRTLIAFGDPPDGLYILLGGRCRVTVPGTAASAEVGAGELLGETAFLADEARTADVVTLRDTVVAFLPAESLLALVERAPQVWKSLGRIAAQRALGRGGAAALGALTLALVPLDPGLDLAWLAGEMRTALGAFGHAARLDGRLAESRSDLDVTAFLGETERAHDYVVYVANSADDPWTRRVIRQADRVVYVADAASAPHVRLVEASPALADSDASRHLLLIQPAGADRATGTPGWLAGRSVASHHHVRRESAADAARAARLLTGRATGLALSGAGARGVAHLGVLRALRELGVDIDVVAGTSAGGAVALCFARGWDEPRTLGVFRALFDAMRPRWYRYAPPLVSLMSGRAPRRALLASVGDGDLEDELVPIVVTATDLTTGSLFVFERGPAWRALRATGSVPMLWPPLQHEGRLLVDGGLVANVPVGVLDRWCATGRVIASDLTFGQDAFPRLEAYGDSLSGWAALWARLWPFGRRRRYPWLVDVMIGAMCLPDHGARAALGARARRGDVLVLRPPAPDVGFFGLDGLGVESIIAEADRYAREKLLVATAAAAGAPPGSAPTFDASRRAGGA